MKNGVKVIKEPMLRRIISAITQVQTAEECGDLALVSRGLGIDNHAFLMVRKQSPHNLELKSQASQLCMNHCEIGVRTSISI